MFFENLQIDNQDPVSVEVTFGEWLPDQPERNNPGAVEALNVLPVSGSYGPFLQLALDNGDPLLDRVRGAASVIEEDGVVQLFAGTVNGLFTRLGAADWTGLVPGAFSER